jgi:hypothetical protein
MSHDKNYLKEISNFVRLNVDDDKFSILKNSLYKADFILFNEEDDEISKKVKRVVRKTGIENNGNFYQLFYYFIITFENKTLKVIILNSEINKFISIIKNFIKSESSIIKKEVLDVLDGFTFENKHYVEDIKTFIYKQNLVSTLKKFVNSRRFVYKSSKMIEGKVNSNISFSILSDDDYSYYYEKGINNSKLNVISNFLFILKDLDIISDFQ